jgi:ABC-2 type transport system ATP-binding protein
MRQPVIAINNVSAVYGRGARQVQALRGVTLSVQPGEIFGLLGPNGAGKTTLLACVEGLHRPVQGKGARLSWAPSAHAVAGSIQVAGLDVEQQPTAVKRKLGLQLQRAALLNDLTVSELLEVYAALYEVYLTQQQVTDLLARFDLSAQRHVLARRLSGGQQQRLCLAIAIAHDPEIVLLDEPTTGLDPHARRAVWDLIRQLHSDGRTLVLTTHAMEEAETLCDRVAIIDHGQIVACDTPACLIAALKAHTVLKMPAEFPLEEVRQLLGVQHVRHTDQHLEIETTQPLATLAALHDLAAHCGRTVNNVLLRQPNLEDVFLSLTGHPLQA